jgi:CRP/FNR family transcriptional regulator, cyclic AMP receptor protein
MRRQLLSHCPVVIAGAGQTVGIPAGTTLVVVASGLVASTFGRPDRRYVTFLAGEGDLLPWPTDGITLEALYPSRVIIVDAETRQALLADPETAADLVDGLAAAVLEREESLSQIAGLVHRDRVLAKLVQLARKFGRVTPEGVRLELPLTHQLLADTLGTARETVSIAFRDLQRHGTVERRGRTYLLKLPPREIGARSSAPSSEP